MDTHADNTIVEKEEEVSEQGQEDREDQVEDLQEHKERVIEEELGAEEDKVENNKIVDIESASEDDADDDIDNPQEDHDHQSESVKSEDLPTNEEALKNKLQKKASVVFERKDSDGSSFWSLSARNSVTSMFEAASDQTEDDAEAAEPQSPKKMLQKKRSSLSQHRPDPSLLDRKMSQQQPEAVYEFQKVRMSGLKPVDNQMKEQKKDAEETKENKNNEDSVELASKKCDLITDGKSIKGGKNVKESKAKADADGKKKVSTTTKSGVKNPSVSGGKKKPIPPKPGSAQKDSKSPATGVSSVARTSSARHKDASKNAPKPKTASDTENPSSTSNEGKRKTKSDPPSTVKSQTRTPVERTMSARTATGPERTDSKTDLKRTTSLRKQEQKPPVTGAPSRTPAARAVTKTGSKTNIKDNLDTDNSVTFRSRTKRAPPPVPPKPRPGDKIDLKDLASAGPAPALATKKSRSVQERKNSASKTSVSSASRETKTSAVKPVMKKMAAKTSVAEKARLADTQDTEAGAARASAGSKFVSHARATLSPAPARKQRPIETVDSDAESEVERAESKETEESGIVSESVSASSVILMFGGTGKFKKSHGAPSKDGEGKVEENPEKSTEQIFKSTKKLSAVKKMSTSSNTESSRKKSQTKKKNSVDSKSDRKSSNPRKSSQKSGDCVIKTSMTVRLKSLNTDAETEKQSKKVSIDEDVHGKHGDTSHSAISTQEFDFKMSSDKSRQ